MKRPVVCTETVAKHAFQVGWSLNNNNVAIDTCKMIGWLNTRVRLWYKLVRLLGVGLYVIYTASGWYVEPIE